MHLLVTGAAGFIGSNFTRWWLDRHAGDRVVALDLLTYAGNRPNLDGIKLALIAPCLTLPYTLQPSGGGRFRSSARYSSWRPLSAARKQRRWNASAT